MRNTDAMRERYDGKAISTTTAAAKKKYAIAVAKITCYPWVVERLLLVDALARLLQTGDHGPRHFSTYGLIVKLAYHI